MRNITFLGDSLTVGYGLAHPQMQSVPSLIQKKIQEELLDYEVYNAGLSGSTSTNALYRLDSWLRRPIDVFVLQVGINDLIRKVPLERTAKNMDDICKKVLDRNPQCKLVLLGMRLPKNTQSPLVDAFNGLYPGLAKRFHLTYVQFYLEGVAGVRHLNLPDGLHPNAEGYLLIAERIWPVIRSLLLPHQKNEYKLNDNLPEVNR